MYKILFLSQGYHSLSMIKDLIGSGFDLDIIVQTPNTEFFLIENEIKNFKNTYYLNSREEFLELFNTLISKTKYDYIFPMFPDQYVSAIAKANGRLGIPGISKDVADNIKEKKIYYEIWKNLGIPIPDIYQIIPNKQRLSDTSSILKYPCIVKPSGGMSSLGIKIFNNEKSLKDFFEDVSVKVHDYQESNGDKFKNFEYYSADTDYMIQEYIEGEIVSIIGHVFDFQISLDFIYDIQSDAYPYASETRLVFPSSVPSNQLEKIYEHVKKFINSINLNNTPFMFDIIIKNDKFYFIDFAARISAGSQLLKYAGEKNYGSKLVSSILNKTSFSLNCDKHAVKQRLPFKVGKIKSLIIKKESLADYIKYPTNNKINLPRNDIAISNNGYVYVTGNDSRELDQKYRDLVDSIEIDYE
jgi:carbamoylphosphate synthase large subunit